MTDLALWPLKPQTQTVLRLLRSSGRAGITPLEALREAGTLRLAARIHELRRAGYRIEAERVAPSIWRYRLLEG